MVHLGFFSFWGGNCNDLYDPDRHQGRQKKVTIKKFILYQFIIALIVGGAAFYPLYVNVGAQATGFVYIAMALAFIAGALAYTITYNGIQKNVRFFTTYLIGGMLIKLFAGIFSITIIGLALREFAVHFALGYFGSYMIFTGFEVYAILPAARQDNPKQ